MTTKRVHMILDRLDRCMDETEHAEILVALNFIRRMVLKVWKENQCCTIDTSALFAELVSLGLLCMKGSWHPAIPLALCRVIMRLCTPVISSQEEIVDQCWRHADLIRILRAWLPVIENVLVYYDSRTQKEVRDVLQAESNMMKEIFDQYLILYRSAVQERNSQLRHQHLAMIENYRRQLKLPEVSEQVMQIGINKEILTDNVFRSAEID